jgi:hypothetical protein
VATMLLIRACQISLVALTLVAGLFLRGPRATGLHARASEPQA